MLVLQATPVERYLAEENPSARSRILRTITDSLKEVEQQLRTPPSRPGAPETGRVIRKKMKAAHPAGGPFEYVLWVPKSYTPDKQWRLIINLHGSGGTGDGALGRWLDDLKKSDDTFLLCPSAKRGGWGGSLLGHAYILQSMRDVMTDYAIDIDRVFLDGASMGGNGSFQFACLYPDLFAGAMPRSGGPRFIRDRKTGKVTSEGVENLVALPVYWVIGAKDGKLPHEWVQEAKGRIDALKSDFTYREYPNGGHEWFRGARPVKDRPQMREVGAVGQARRVHRDRNHGVEAQQREVRQVVAVEALVSQVGVDAAQPAQAPAAGSQPPPIRHRDRVRVTADDMGDTTATVHKDADLASDLKTDLGEFSGEFLIDDAIDR